MTTFTSEDRKSAEKSMNLLELAMELEDCGQFFEDGLYTKASAMLRKQAEEIEYWKEKFEKAMELKR